jgi:hypothetical protein
MVFLLSSSGFTVVFLVPIVGTAVLFLLMLFKRELWRALLFAVLVCAALAAVVVLGIRGPTGDSGYSILVLAVLSPWLCFLVFVVSFTIGNRRAIFGGML